MSASALLNLILWQGIGPIFVRSGNPALYPFVLAALVISLAFFVREVVLDTIRYLRNGRQSLAGLIANFRIDIIYFAGSWLLIYLLWLAFTIPADALPLLPAPAPGAMFGPVAWRTVYAFIAVILHLLVSFFALQFLVGICLGYIGTGVPGRAVDAVTILVNGSVIFGWEVSRWPSPFIIPAEIYLTFPFAFLLMQLVTPEQATNKAVRRAQYVCMALLSLVGTAIVWMLHGIGIPADIAGLIVRSANPALYPVALVAMVISYATTLVGGALTPYWPVKQRKAMQDAMGGMVFSWLVQLGLLWLAWWGLTSPMTQLPFVTVTTRAAIAGISLATVVNAIAIALHALVFTIATSNLLTAWIVGLLRIPASRFQEGVLPTITLAIPISILRMLSWPVWIVVVLELSALMIFISPNVEDWMDSALEWFRVSKPIAHRRLQRFQKSLARIVLFVAVALIVMSNGSTIYAVEFFGLYYLLTQVDSVVVGLWGVINADKGFDGSLELLSPRRWQLTFPMICVLSLLGAAGFFRSITPMSAATYGLWLDVGAAAIAYMIFKPLIAYADVRVFSVTISPSYVDRPEWATEIARSSQAAGLAADALVSGRPFATSVRSYQQGMRTKELMGGGYPRGLRFFTGPLFYILALAYHLLTVSLNLPTLLGSSLVPLILGFIGLAPSLLQLFDIPKNARYISLLLVWNVIVVACATGLFALAQLPAPLTPAQITALGFIAALGNKAFLANSVYAILRELLFLLTLGQLVYIYRFIEASLISSSSPLAHGGMTAEDEVELGERLVRQKQTARASDWLKGAISYANEDARLIRRAGLDLQRSEQYEAALNAYEKAISLEPTNPIYWNDKGVALSALHRTQDAIAAYQHAIDLDQSYARAWDNKGDELSRLGRFDEAIIAYQKATQFATPANDNPDVYLNDLGLALMNERRYDDALTAIDRALKIDKKWAYTWRNRADILLNLPNRAREALAAAERSLRLEGNSLRGWSLYGAALEAAGQSDEARSAWEFAVALDPEPSATWTSYGDALAGLGRYDEALTSFDRALKDTPNDPDIWRSRARALRALGRESEAWEAERRERQLSSGTPPPAP